MYSQNNFHELVKEMLAAEADLSEVSDAQIEEFIDGVMAEDPTGMIFIATINSITDTELITTDEDGERDVATRQNQDPLNPPVDVQDVIDKGLETRITDVSNPLSILFW